MRTDILIILIALLILSVHSLDNASNPQKKTIQMKKPTDRRPPNNSPTNYNNNRNERQTFTKNREKFNHEGGDGKSKEWKSGYIFGQYNRKQQRNDPWWMRDEEKNNPRIIPSHRPWWYSNDIYVEITSTTKIAELRQEADRRGVKHDGLKKAELYNELHHLDSIYSLTDDNFRTPTLANESADMKRPSCYPEVYEGSAENIEKLKSKIMLIPATSGNTNVNNKK